MLSEYNNTTDAIERRLLQLWQELFPERSVQRQDEFFQLGGNSLQLARLYGALQREFAVRLDFQCVLQNTELQALARLIAGVCATNGAAT